MVGLRKVIPYGRQNISREDIEAVINVLNSDWLTQGPVVEEFERQVAEYCGAQYAVAVCNATAALHIACLAADLGQGDVMWTSPNTFVASANCGRYCGSEVDFVDIDSATYNLSLQALERKLEQAEREGKLPKIVIPVHFAGQSCDMKGISALAKRYGFTVIEDASHAIGGRYLDKPIGSCQFSDMAVFSFHPVKILTTGEGGMVLTNRKDLYEKLIRLRSHGITRDPKMMREVPHGSWYYQQIDLGFNYRITEMQCALGLSQLTRLDSFVSRRHALAQRYNEGLKNFPIVTPWQHPDSYSAYHLYVIRLKRDLITLSHQEVFERLRAAGILVNLHYIPVHTQPYYQDLGFTWGDFPESENYYREAISLPLYYDLSEDEQDFVIQTIGAILT